jgi:hypothetical protein
LVTAVHSGDLSLIASGFEITEKQKRDLVRRVLQSSLISSSRALQAFLQFVTDHAIAGDLEAIKEQRIGTEVLGRKPDYDPAADNIVRVRAHELRQKLARHFSEEGAAEPIVITIPKGSYVPLFMPRPVPLPNKVTPESVTARAKTALRAWAPWTLVCVLAAVTVLQLLFASRTPVWGKEVSVPPSIRDLWGPFFESGREPTVVSADSSFALWQDITGRSIDLGDYITKKFIQVSTGDSRMKEVAARLCTSPADVSVVLQTAEVGRLLHGQVRHRYARDMTAGELRTNNVVLLGSRRSNPWDGLFESRMNFVLSMDGQAGAPHFHNKAPLPGEPSDFSIQSRFDSDGAENRQMVTYGVAALVPNLSASGQILMIEGLSMEGTAAIGDVLTNSEKLAALLRKLGHKPGTPVRPFEAVIKLTSIPGGFAYPEIIAVR